MLTSKLFFSRFYLIACLLIFSNFGFTQHCDSLTLDVITDPGIYNFASLTDSDGLRNGPDYAEATVYYPTNASPPFASIVIVPGYVSPQSTIQDWGPFYASHGIVAMTIGTNSLFDDPYRRKDALLDAIITLSEENTRMNSPLVGNLDTNRIAVSGWSMGGGAAQLAAVADTTLMAVVALCPWLDTDKLIQSDLNHPVPVLIFSGEADGIAPPSVHANVHYDYTPQTTNKLIFEVDNAGHSVANGPTGGQDDVGKIALSWLKEFLISDSCYCPLLLDTPTTASSYMTNLVCSPISTSTDDTQIENIRSYKLYPNPSQGSFNLEVENVDFESNYEIVTLSGTKLISGNLINKITNIDTQNLTSGVYIINVIRSQVSERTMFIVK